MAKILNFDSFGAVAPHFCPDKREIWHWGADRRGQCVAPGGRKPIFGQLNKCNYRHVCASRRAVGNKRKP